MSLGRRMYFPYWVVIAFLAWPGVLPGCADERGVDAYALFSSFEHEDDLYRFRYLSPPWEFLDDGDDGDRQLLAVDPDLRSIGFEMEKGYLGARYKMLVAVLGEGTVRQSVEADLLRWRESGAEATAPVIFESAQGRLGIVVEAVFRDRRMVSIYHATRTGEVAVMRVAAQESLDTYDMELLFKGFEPSAKGNGRDGD